MINPLGEKRGEESGQQSLAVCVLDWSIASSSSQEKGFVIAAYFYAYDPSRIEDQYFGVL